MSSPQVHFTDDAALKVHSLIVEEGDASLNLRVYITGGGCSGFQYGFTFDDTIAHDDTVVEKQLKLENNVDSATSEVVKLLIDPMSYQYLVGAEIDYADDLQGARFIIRNPNAKTTCGCGASFSTDD